MRYPSCWPIVGLTLGVSASLIGMVSLLHFWKGIPLGRLTRDPVAIFDAPFYVGFLSQIGIFLWSASAAVCLFCALVFRGSLEHKNVRKFLLVSGLLTLLLGLDDAFLLHEGFFPRFGIPETIVFIVYAGALTAYLVSFPSLILNTEYALLTVALFFFGVSIALDLFEPPIPKLILFEDGAKLLGIVSWLFYFVRVAEWTLFQSFGLLDRQPDASTPFPRST